jgi:lysozyme
MVSFAVSSKEGGGLRAKYEPVLDANGQPLISNGMPVMQALPATGYEQDIGKIFGSIFGSRLNPKQAAQLESKYWSFTGLVDAMNTLVTPEEKQSVLSAFIDKIFGKGAQGLYKGDPERDSAEKSAALDLMINKLGVQTPSDLEQMKQQYKASYRVTAESLQEAEVKAQFRKNMPHLRDLKPIDFLDLLDEIHDGNGNFKLQNIPLNVKIDGFGGRFGKDAEGKPFMATSNTPPRYKAGFVQYHQDKGTTDPEILGRAEKFDELFNEMMNAIKLVDSKLGADFLVNKQVTCEVLFLPFAAETSEGKLKFVGIQYDKFPPGVELVLVPFRVVDASSGEDVPDANDVVTSLSKLGGQGSVRFLSNSLVQKDGLDVTEIINPLDNIEELKQIVSDTAGKRDRASLQLRREVEEKLMPVKIALEKAIDADPNIIGKDILGQDYEGIVINSRLGPIKVTSQQQKDIITQKNAAKAAARAEQPRGENKTAVVAIGSFVGHKGHQQLFGLTINKAKEVSGDPYLFMGSAVGADDPIPVADKIKTWKQLYPEYAGNISAVTQEGGSLMQKIKHELINPLPGKPPRYDNVIIMVGEDQAKMPIAQALMKAVNKFPGYEHVKVQLEVTPRGTGMSFTKLRNVLKTGDEQQAFQMWNDAFNGGQDGAKPLPSQWIKHLMDVSKTGMSTPQPKPAVKKPAVLPTPQTVQQPALGEMRLFNALMSPKKIVNEKTIEERKRKKSKGAAWGPGPYGWYGFDAGYSGNGGDGGSDGGESMNQENFADSRNPQDNSNSKRQMLKIASLNNIKDVNKINAGQMLKLPNGTTYKVMPGDTLSTIAARQVKDQSSPMPQPSVKQGPNSNIDQTTRDKAQAFVGQQKPEMGGGRGVVNPATVRPDEPTQTGVRSGPNTNIDQPARDRAKAAVTKISSEDDIMNMVKDHEGVKNKPYQDTKGLWTVGVGHLIGDGKTLPSEWKRTFSDAEIMNLFKKDYQHHKQAAEKIPGFSNLNMNGQAALIDLTFNMGPRWWKAWPNFTKAMQAGNIDQAANALKNSAWYSQVGRRAPKIVSLLQSGDRSVAENFADGRNPQDKGDSKRHGVPTKSSVSNLRKVAKQGGRKGQLAHWMANMKAGKAKAKNEDFNGEYDDEAGMAQSNLRTMARAVDGLLKTIKSNDNLPEWGQEKIAKAEMMLVSVWDYLLSQKEMGMDPKINESKAVESLRQIVAELSNEKLGQYKKAAGDQATAADKAGDYAKGHKRFKGIVKATNKQFDNDAKKHREQGMAEAGSNAIDTVSKRLTDPKDGMTAKLRAAGDKKRDSQYMGTQIAKNDRTSKDEWGNLKEKIKGADGKACWKGYKYAGTKNGKDKCVPIGEAYELEMTLAILKLFESNK